MILEMFMVLNYEIFKVLFGWLPNIPPMPVIVTGILEELLNWSAYGFGLIKFLLGNDFCNILLHITLTLVSFKYSYMFIMFVIRKLPLGVK